jgi:hypothetical protein
LTNSRLLALAGIAALIIVAAGAALAIPPLLDSAPAVPHFVDEGQAAGVTHSYDGGFEFYTGGGVAAFDCNGDGLPELYFAGGSNPAALYVNASQPGGRLAFDRLADPVTDLDSVTGAYPLDVDGDGITDLFVIRHGENVLLRGLGDCRFARANEQWSFTGSDAWPSAFSATWEAGNDWPTLAVGSYLDESKSPPGNLCLDNQLFRPAPAGGGFGSPIALSPGWCTLSMLFSSWDRSGRADLRVSNDRHYYSDYSGGQEQLWRVAPGEQPRLYTAADGWQAVHIWGMGIGSYDINGDGYPDYYLTSQGANKLQTLTGSAASPDFHEIALQRNVTATRPYAGDTALPSTSWTPVFADLNNDALMDLFVTKGNVEAEADYAMRDPNDLMLGQPDGTFTEAAQAAGLLSFARGRGAVVVDLNGDGLLDIVVVNRVDNVAIWRNLGAGTAEQPAAMGNWLGVELSQPGANRNAIGAWLEVRVNGQVMQREVTVGGGQASGQLLPLHFGLGSAATAEVRVSWPDGSQGNWQSFAANQVVQVSR